MNTKQAQPTQGETFRDSHVRALEKQVIQYALQRDELLAALKAIGKQCRDSNEPTAISVRLQVSEIIGQIEGTAQ